MRKGRTILYMRRENSGRIYYSNTKKWESVLWRRWKNVWCAEMFLFRACVEFKRRQQRQGVKVVFLSPQNQSVVWFPPGSILTHSLTLCVSSCSFGIVLLLLLLTRFTTITMWLAFTLLVVPYYITYTLNSVQSFVIVDVFVTQGDLVLWTNWLIVHFDKK